MAAKRSTAVVFVHGLARKPAPEKLKEIWLWALGRDNPMPSVFAPPNPGIDLDGIPVRFSYYADVFYGTEYETDLDSYYEATGALEIQAEALDRVETELTMPQPVAPRERAFLRGFEAKLSAQAVLRSVASPPTAAEVTPVPDEIAGWLPDPVKQAIIKKAAMEAYYFLFDKEFVRSDGVRFQVRRELRSRLLEQLSAGRNLADDVVVVSHSMGTMIAYDVVRNSPECPRVDTLLTLGSPLGISEVQDELVAIDADHVDFPASTVNQWINVYDPLDPICGADPKFANDFNPVNGKAVTDIREQNWGRWRHSITHYLAGRQFRTHLARALGLS